MEDFHGKACLVAGGHMTNTPDTITYSSVVTRQTVCIVFTMAVLHDLEIKAADVLNAYVMAPNHEKLWTVVGPELWNDAGKSAIIVRVLSGLKNDGTSFWSHLSQFMWKLGYCHCDDVDSDLWMKAEYRPEENLQCYFYILCYVDDILCIPHDPDDVLNKLNGCMLLKPGWVGSPDMYLSIKLKCMQLHNGIWAWSMSPSKYFWEAVRICKEYVAKHLSKECRLPKRADNPFEIIFYPELDVSPVLGPGEASYYQSLIGAMRWMIEIWQIDFNTKVPYYHHTQQCWDSSIWIMGYLKLRHNSRLMFDSYYPDIDHSNFWECDWTDFYKGAVEVIPPNAPLSIGKEVDLCIFI